MVSIQPVITLHRPKRLSMVNDKISLSNYIHKYFSPQVIPSIQNERIPSIITEIFLLIIHDEDTMYHYVLTEVHIYLS